MMTKWLLGRQANQIFKHMLKVELLIHPTGLWFIKSAPLLRPLPYVEQAGLLLAQPLCFFSWLLLA